MYLLPQVRVFEEFKQVPQTSVKKLNPFIFGPHYTLFRYSVESEKVYTGLGAYDRNNDVDYLFPSQPANSKVDFDYVKVFVDEAWIEYATLASSTQHAIVADDASKRNRLRATPWIAPFKSSQGGVTLGNIEENGQEIAAPGYFIGKANLPESYYFVPYGGWSGTAWSSSEWRSIFDSYQDGKLLYVTSEGGRGTVTLDATPSGVATLTTQGVTTVIPELGIHLDFNNGSRYVTDLGSDGSVSFSVEIGTNTYTVSASTGRSLEDAVKALYAAGLKDDSAFIEAFVDYTSGTIKLLTSISVDVTVDGSLVTTKIENSIYAPREVRFLDSDGNYISLRLKESKFADAINMTVEDDRPLTVLLDHTQSTGFDNADNILTVKSDSTLKDLYADLTGDTTITNLFNIVISSNAVKESTNTVATIRSQNWNTTMCDGGSYLIVPDCFKTTVQANQYTFKTGNGYTRSSDFYSRDVAPGDILRYQVDTSVGTIECETSVVSVETDYTLAKVDPVTLDAGNVGYNINDPTQGRDLGGETDVTIVPGGDNQRNFDGSIGTSPNVLSAGVKVLSPLYDAYPGDYSNGLLNDTYTVRITTSGEPGQARASVINSTGTFKRTNVLIEKIDNYADAARIYLGKNIYLVFVKAAGDEDMVFQYNDTYTFSTAVKAAYDSIDTRSVFSSGVFNGSVDTTYTVEVIRGGVFEQNIVASEGTTPSSSYKIKYTGSGTPDLPNGATLKFTPLGKSELTLFELNSDTSLTDVADAINNNNNVDVRINYHAEVNTTDNSLTIYARNEYIQGEGLTGAADFIGYWGNIRADVRVNGGFSAYPGDVDDEYSVEVAVGGPISSARLNARSIRGDGKIGINYGAFDEYQSVGNNNVELVFHTQDYKVIKVTNISDGDVITDGTLSVTLDPTDAASLQDTADTIASTFNVTAVVDGSDIRISGSKAIIDTLEHKDPSTGQTVTGGIVVEQDSLVDPNFKAGSYWVIHVLASRPLVRISDTAGIDESSLVVVDNDVAIDLGLYGANIVFTSNNNNAAGMTLSGGLLKGEKFYVTCEASAPGPYKTIVIADDINPIVTFGKGVDGLANKEFDRFAVWLYLRKNGVSIPEKAAIAPDRNWTTQVNSNLEDEITIKQDIQLQDPEIYDASGYHRYLDLYKGNLFVEYRALMSDYADGIYSITDIADIETMIGTLSPDNPLAYGLYKCMQNSADRVVYFMATPTDDLSGYMAVLDQAERHSDLYALAPLTQDRAIHDAVKAHVNALSTEETKRWRRAAVSMAAPVQEAVYTKETHPNNEDWKATIEDDTRFAGSQYRKLVMDDSTNACKFLENVRPGCIVRIQFATDGWGDVTYKTFTVDSVESNTVLYLTDSFDTPITTPTKVEIYKPYTIEEQAKILGDTAASYSDRRVWAIVPPVAIADGQTVSGEFLAAAVAGLACSVPPQQGLTNIEINGFEDMFLCYRYYNRAQLDYMAENGAFIIMQDMAHGPIYVRHQLTTAAKDNNLNTAESSINTNFDSVAYYFDEILTPFIGKYNVTPELIEVIRTNINDGINYLGTLTSVGLLGPQIILDDGNGNRSEIKTIMQHPMLKDHLYVVVTLVLPAPLNSIDLHLVV